MKPLFQNRRWWVVGASEGLGSAIARKLDAEGASLILSARSEDKLRKIAAGLRDARAVLVDVTEPESVRRAVAEAGGVDGLIYCVGSYDPMTASDWDPEGAANMGEINFVGALRLLGHVTPAMVTRGTGRIVLIGSLAGFAGLPGSIGYAASKAGLMHLAEDMCADLKGTGVTVQRTNPGFIRTRLTEKNDFDMPQIMDPDDAAGHVIRAIRSGRFSTSFPKPFSWVFSVGCILPTSVFQRIF